MPFVIPGLARISGRLKTYGFLLEFIPAKAGAGMTLNDYF